MRATARGGAAALIAFLGAGAVSELAIAQASPTLSVGLRNERAEPLCVATAEPRYDVVRLGPPLDAALVELREVSSDIATGGLDSEAGGVDLGALAQRIKALGFQTCRTLFKSCTSAPEARDLGEELALYAEITKKRADAIVAAVDRIAAGVPFAETPPSRGGPEALRVENSQNWSSGAVGFVTVRGFDCVAPRGYREIAADVGLTGGDFQLAIHVPSAGPVPSHGPRGLTPETLQLAGGPYPSGPADAGEGTRFRTPPAREPHRAATQPVSAASAGRPLSFDEIVSRPAGEPLPTEAERLGGPTQTRPFWACIPNNLGAGGYDSVVLRFAAEGGGAPAERAQITCQTLYGGGVSAVEFLGYRWPRQAQPATLIVD